MIKTRGKERNSSLMQCMLIAKLSPSSFKMTWFCFLWAAEQGTEKDLSSYRRDVPVAHFSVNTLEVYLRHTSATPSLP